MITIYADCETKRIYLSKKKVALMWHECRSFIWSFKLYEYGVSEITVAEAVCSSCLNLASQIASKFWAEDAFSFDKAYIKPFRAHPGKTGFDDFFFRLFVFTSGFRRLDNRLRYFGCVLFECFFNPPLIIHHREML